MRVNVHDYSGHPFQVDLSRQLARLGHDVVHNYSSQYITGHGRLAVDPTDPDTLRIQAITASAPFVRYSPPGRIRFELSYARAWQQELRRQNFDVVIACNVPLYGMARMRRYFQRTAQPWIFWHQDIYSAGIAAEADRKLPAPLSTLVRLGAEQAERRLVADAHAVVAIGDPFVEQYHRWRLPTSHVEVIPNWAPVDDLVPGSRSNPWAQRNGLPSSPLRLLYAGTLGRKHNPLLLLDLLDRVQGAGVDAVLVVVSEGVGADEIRAVSRARDDVFTFDFQPAEDLPNVLASADVMIVLLEPDAAQFSVPSKVLSYLSAGRPIVGLVPDGNPCVDDILQAGGCVAVPTVDGAALAAEWLVEQSAKTDAFDVISSQARNLAVAKFDIARIGSRFEAILDRVIGPPGPQHRQTAAALTVEEE